MARVTKARVRQVILVDNEPIDPYYVPERMQFLREDGTIVDPTKDNTKLGWRGEWDPEAEYSINDMVEHDGYFWVASGSIGVGQEPGIGSELDVTTSDAGDAMFGGNEQPARLLPPGITVSPIPPVLGGESNISQPVGGRFFRVEAELGETITIVWEGGPIGLFDGEHGDPLHPVTPGEVDLEDSLSPFTWTIANPVPKTSGTPDIPHITIETHPDVDNLQWVPEGGSAIGIWEAVSANPPELPTGGDAGDRLVKSSGADFEVEWSPASDVFPAGGDVGDFLVKDSSDPGDVVWVPASSVISPDELPPGGADGYILAKASAADGDVEWIEAPSGGSGLPVGGTTGQILVKQSGTDGDADWEDNAGGGGGSGDPSILLDDDFTSDYTENWVVDQGSVVQNEAGGYLTPADSTVIRWLGSDIYNVMLAVEFEVLPSFPAGAGFFSLQVRRNSAGTHGLHVNVNSGGPGTLYKLHGGSYSGISSAHAMNDGSALAANRHFWAALWSYERFVGMRLSNFPLGVGKDPVSDFSTDVSGDAQLFPDAAGRVAIVPESQYCRVHRATIYDLNNLRANG